MTCTTSKGCFAGTFDFNIVPKPINRSKEITTSIYEIWEIKRYKKCTFQINCETTNLRIKK